MTQEGWYRGHGLLFRSDIPLPEFSPAAPGEADVTIRYAEHPPALPERGRAATFMATADEAILDRAGVGSFVVRKGCEILVWPAQDQQPGQVRLFLLGSAMGMLFHQRGQLVLHGAAVVHDGAATVFVGASGAGKSTLAAHLGAAGMPILADDTLVLSETGDGFVTWPGSRVFKLWEDALGPLGASPESLERVTHRDAKFFLPNAAVPADRSVPVAEIIVLGRGREVAPPVPVRGLEALNAVAENTYRPEFVSLLDHHGAHFRLSTRLLESVAVLRLTRPMNLEAMPQVIAMLQRHWLR